MSLLFVFQEKLIFFPGKGIGDTPATIGLDYEDVYLVTDDKIKIHGWYVHNPNAEATLLFFHGNAGIFLIVLNQFPYFMTSVYQFSLSITADTVKVMGDL